MRRFPIVSLTLAALLALPSVATGLSRGTFDGATPARYPQVVAIGLSLPSGSGAGPNDVFPLCTGTLISNTIVVTAAHCVAADVRGHHQTATA